MKTKELKIKKAILFVLLSFCLLVSMFVGNINFASAESLTYSNVLTDLQKDEDFNVEDFVVNEEDYSLQVITISESADNQLLIYVYQPSADIELTAKTINISTEYHNAANFINYDLSLVSRQGVFCKYVVLDFAVSSEKLRCYEISSIFREWNEKYDERPDNENVIEEVSFAVAKQFVFEVIDDKTTFAVSDMDYINIIDKYVGFVRYGDTDYLNSAELIDRHFVAFSTDKRIDKLLEADVYYSQQSVDLHYISVSHFMDNIPNGEQYGEIEEKYAYLTSDGKVDVTSENGYWWGRKNLNYSWDEIQTVDDFVSSVETEDKFSISFFNASVQSKMTEEGLMDLQGQQWVLSFAETSYDYTLGRVAAESKYISVGNVSVLRLKFDTAGIVYDLGVVDNKQTGDDVPDNDVKTGYSLADWFKIILFVLLGIAILVALAPLLPTILSFLFKLIWWVLKGLWWFITLPFEIFKD